MRSPDLQEPFSKIPPPPFDVANLLLMKSATRSELTRRTLSLARRGYLGCLPLGRTEDDDIVVHVHPGAMIFASPVGVAWGSVVDGLTVAPSLRHFVAGRLAQLGVPSLIANARPQYLA